MSVIKRLKKKEKGERLLFLDKDACPLFWSLVNIHSRELTSACLPLSFLVIHFTCSNRFFIFSEKTNYQL